ncbi:MAG TPA: hypothetical protein VJQ52_22295 [Steroidobacteraceae bacterium]|nr:hypothetical protein [Steroidobacteraceae bacterium]
MKRRFIASLCVAVGTTALVGSAQAANPMGLAYTSTTNVSLYGKSTGLMITGRCNRNSSVFQQVRNRGGEVLFYISPAAVPDNDTCTLDQQYYMGNAGRVPLWPWPSYGQRIMRPGNHLADIRKGSAWSNHIVNYVTNIMKTRKFDGVFIDTCGGRPWTSYSNWTKWSATEKNAWTDGCADLVRRLDAKRRAIWPKFIIVNNNTWDRSDGSTRGYAAHKYIDGIGLEHPAGLTTYYKNYAAKAFSNLGHRRMFVIARSASEARAWANVKGVTHVSSQAKYNNPTVPPVPFRALSDR